MKKLTANQLTLLLQIQRGDYDNRLTEVDKDLLSLKKAKLIDDDSTSEWHITSIGAKYIDRILNVEEKKPDDMLSVLTDLFGMGFKLVMEAGNIYNMAEISAVDKKTGLEHISVLPLDHHLNYSLLGVIKHNTTELLKTTSSKQQ